MARFFLDDDMNDFTNSRGPVVLSKRARHRLIPRPSPPRGGFVKQIPECQDFGGWLLFARNYY